MEEIAPSMREKILISARGVAQAHGYGGLSFRNLASDVQWATLESLHKVVQAFL